MPLPTPLQVRLPLCLPGSADLKLVPLSLAESAISWEVSRGRGRVLPHVVALFLYRPLHCRPRVTLHASPRGWQLYPGGSLRADISSAKATGHIVC